MIRLIVAAWLSAVTPSPEAVEALVRALPPGTASAEVLTAHVAAARSAGYLYDVDPDKLLAIAWHESNFKAGTVTREPGHRVSCGPMTPVPKRRCYADELTVRGGYVAGAEHYRVWLDRCSGSSWCADLAYAGGMGTVQRCARGKTVTAPYSHHDVCRLHEDLERRARLIRRALGGAS